MAAPVLSAAKRLAKHSGWRLSNLELQKLLYLSHMFYLGRTGGDPLVQGNFEAWDYGPVHPELYHRAKIFGSDPVADIFHDANDLPEGPETAILEEAYNSLGKAGPARLVNATHRKNGAWDRNYVPGMRHCVIHNSEILAEYKELANGHAAA